MIHGLSSSLRSFRRATEGASAVEFAIVITPLLVIVFGSIEFGRLMWTRQALQETAMAVSRCMGVKQSTCATGQTYSSTKTLSYVQSLATDWSITIPASGVTLNANAAGSFCGGTSGFSFVSITYTFQTAVPLLLGSLSNGVPINASACFPNQS